MGWEVSRTWGTVGGTIALRTHGSLYDFKVEDLRGEEKDLLSGGWGRLGRGQPEGRGKETYVTLVTIKNFL